MSSPIHLSVIVPALNAQQTIRPCLQAITESRNHQGGIVNETIVVDASSTDQTPLLAKEFDCRIIQSKKPLNPSQARNLGAQNAQGDVLVFIDSDVVVGPNVLSSLSESFRSTKSAAVAGIYSKPTEDENFASAFQTLFLRNRFSELDPIVKTPHSAIFAIRKDDFFLVSGFDENLQTYEDFDLGHRLSERGIQSRIEIGIEARHLKKFSFLTLVKDYWVKTKNMMNHRIKNAAGRKMLTSPADIGLPAGLFWSGIISAPLFGATLILWTQQTHFYWLALAWMIYLVLIFPFLSYLTREKGAWFAIRGGVILLLCQVTSSLAIMSSCFCYPIQRIFNDDKLENLKRTWLAFKLPKFINIGRRVIHKPGLPVQLIFFVTSKCNLHCEHCFYLPYLNKAKNELSLDEIEKISRSLSDLLWLALTGGEPLLRKDIDQIVETFYKNNRVRKITITTNGIIKDQSIDLLEKVLKKIPKAQLMVYFSLDGLPDTHNKIRRIPNGFERTVATIKAAKELKKHYPNLFVSTITTCTAHNQWEMSQLANKILDEIEPDNMVVNMVRGDLEDPSLKDLDIKNYHTFIKIQQEAIRSGRLKYFNFIGKRLLLAKEALQKEIITDVFLNQHFVTPCYAGHLSAVLYESGEVAPCEILNTRYGNIRDYQYDFSRIWQRSEVRGHAKSIIKNKCFCTYECALTTNILFNPSHALKLMQTKSQF